jgi:gamma-glutamyl-gamma-aminobutyrate hydrolase PuuD
MRLFCIGSWYGAERPFMKLFSDTFVLGDREAKDWKFTKDDVVLFGGGADIWPGLYKQQPSRYNGSPQLSKRDIVEADTVARAKAAGSKLLGICRGAQLLCAMAGGTVVQHVTGHAGHDHPILTKDGEMLDVSSAHHQMMNPTGVEHELIAYTPNTISRCFLGENEVDIPMEVEPEVVYFPTLSALAIQYHPEFMADGERGVTYAIEQVQKYLIGE